jgi:hypothetical protein
MKLKTIAFVERNFYRRVLSKQKLLKILYIMVKIDTDSNILTNHEICIGGQYLLPLIGFVPSNLFVRKIEKNESILKMKTIGRLVNLKEKKIAKSFLNYLD